MGKNISPRTDTALRQLACSPDGHARIIHNTIMSHPAVKFVKVGHLFQAAFNTAVQHRQKPAARWYAAEFTLAILDGIAKELNMNIPAREPVPVGHQHRSDKYYEPKVQL